MAPRKMTFEDYTITEEGEVINNFTKKKLKPQPNNKGYLRVQLAGKRYFVHRLVAEKYIPNPDNKPQVNHIDGNKNNNRVDNLEWVTNQENRNHAIQNNLHLCGENCPWAKLTNEQVQFIREHLELSSIELSKMFKVSVYTIRDIYNYKTWKDS